MRFLTLLLLLGFSGAIVNSQRRQQACMPILELRTLMSTPHNRISMSLTDLKNLGTQLYSAAEYFEMSYTEEDQKRIVMNTLKDYVINAVVNTVSHLTAMSHSLDDFVDDYVNVDAPAMEFHVSCAEQRVKTYQEYVDQAAISQQSLLVRNTNYHKRYILPVGGSMPGSASEAVPQNSEFHLHELGSESRLFQDAFSATLKQKPRSSRKSLSISVSQKIRSTSPSRQPRSTSPSQLPKDSQATRRADSPIPGSNPSSLIRSGSVANTRPTGLNPIKTSRQIPAEPPKSSTMKKISSLQKLPSMRKSPSLCRPPVNISSTSVCLRAAEEEHEPKLEHHQRKPKVSLKKLLSRKKTKKDDTIYTLLDDY